MFATGRQLSAMLVLYVAFVALAIAPALVQAHAGHFHLCPDTPSGKGYTRMEVGNCSSFVSLTPGSGLAMTGKVTMLVYAYRNCSDDISSALEFATTITRNGQPLATANTTGYAYTGQCSSPGRSIYLQEAAAGMDDENLIFWEPALTGADGSLCGNAANSFVIRTRDTAGQAEAPQLNSVVITVTDVGSLCCDFNLAPRPPLSLLLDNSSPCDVAASPPPQTSPPPPRSPPPPAPGAAAGLRASLMAMLGGAMLLALLLAP